MKLPADAGFQASNGHSIPLARRASPTLPSAVRMSLSFWDTPLLRPTVLPARKVTVSAPRPSTCSRPCESEAITTSSPCNSSFVSDGPIQSSNPAIYQSTNLPIQSLPRQRTCFASADGPALQFFQVEIQGTVLRIELFGGQPALACFFHLASAQGRKALIDK